MDDNGYMGLDSISFLDFENGWQQTVSPMCALPMGPAPPAGEQRARGHLRLRRGYSISFFHTPEGRLLTFRMEDFAGSGPIDGRILLTDEPPESIVMCTPFTLR